MDEKTGIPSKKGSGGLIALGLLMLAGAGGLIYWGTQRGSQTEVEEVRKVAPAPAPTVEQLAEAPPPPPPDEELEEKEEQPKTEATSAKKATGPSGCAGTCKGTATEALKSALRARAGQARTCYNRALRVNSMLEGKLSVAVRVSSSGNACSASVTSDSLGDPSVSSCVVEKFRSGKYPTPQGGCVDTAIPLNFVKKQ